MSKKTYQEKRSEHDERQKKQERQKNLKTWGMWGGVVFVLIVAVWGLAQLDSKEAPVESSFQEKMADDHVKGNPDAQTVIIEYSDFECPACQGVSSVIKQFVGEHEQDVAFVYRHFPLTSIHEHARLAAQASEAAANQGMFWEMHDKLFEEQNSWKSGVVDEGEAKELFVSYAKELGLDEGQFRTDIDAKEIVDKVNAHRAAALKGKLRGTPSILVDGEVVDTPRTVEQFEEFLKETGQ